MVLEVEPATKDLKATVLRPRRFVVEPLNHPDNCSVKISLHRSRKDWLSLSSCVALGDQVEHWFP
jgi:hypothetical protein